MLLVQISIFHNMQNDFLFLSFEKGEIFIVRDVLDETYWVTSEKTGESGIVYQALVEDLVCILSF